MLSQPLVSVPAIGCGLSWFASEKIAIFGLLVLKDGAPPTPLPGRLGCDSSGLGADANGSIFAAKAGRIVGRAGEEGPSAFCGLDSNRF